MQKQAHWRPVCILSDLLRATQAGGVWSQECMAALRGPSLL